ncbi:MAG: hypothetical protein R3E96_16645, partial [Planctomycetota bacterium]
MIWTLPPADQAQVLKLSLPQGHSFVRLAEPLLREVRLVDAAPGERLERQGQGWSWFRTAGRTGQLRWTVPLEHRDLPDVQASGSAVDWPYSDENHALLSGATLFLMPEGDSGPSLVQFETPDGWARWTPWAEQADGRYFVADSADLASAYLCAGQWTETRLSHGDFQASLLIWPGQAEALAPLAEDLQPLLEELAAYREWNPDKRHLLILSRPDLMGLGGSLVGRCLPMGVQAGLEGARKEICHLPAHECLHLLGAPRVPLGADLRWLVEGGTEFLAWRMLGKAGQAGALERFLAEVDLWAQGQAPVWDRSLADMGGAVFFEGGAEYDAIYRAGAMVSAWLHMALQG